MQTQPTRPPRCGTRIALFVVGLVLVVSACGGLPNGAAVRAAPTQSPALLVPPDSAAIERAADLAVTLDDAHYEYFQLVTSPDGQVAGSDSVPLARGVRLGDGERLTAELGIDPTFAAVHGTNTRLNVLATEGTVCMNVPFYESIIDQAGPDENTVWMMPLVDGWGCLNEADVVDATGVPSAALDLGDQNLYLRMAEVLRSGGLAGWESGTYRGQPVTIANVVVDTASVAKRYSTSTDGVVEASAQIRFNAADATLISIEVVTQLSDGPHVTERLEIYGRGTVDPIELPEDATDITEPISQVLAD